MTLCIAALCRDGDETKAVISYDRRIQTGTAGGDIGLKLTTLSKKWCALYAGDTGLARELIVKYQVCLQAHDDHEMEPGKTLNIIRGPLNELREEFADRYVHRELGVRRDDFLRGTYEIPEDTVARTWYQIPEQVPRSNDLQLLLIGRPRENLILIKICGVEINSWGEPFFAIGAGADIAEPALFQRRHMSRHGLARTMYEVYEAHTLGSIAPGVSKARNMGYAYFNPATGCLDFKVALTATRNLLETKYAEFGLQPIRHFDMPPADQAFTDYPNPWAKLSPPPA